MNVEEGSKNPKLDKGQHSLRLRCQDAKTYYARILKAHSHSHSMSGGFI